MARRRVKGTSRFHRPNGDLVMAFKATVDNTPHPLNRRHQLCRRIAQRWGSHHDFVCDVYLPASYGVESIEDISIATLEQLADVKPTDIL